MRREQLGLADRDYMKADYSPSKKEEKERKPSLRSRIGFLFWRLKRGLTGQGAGKRDSKS